MPNTAPTEATGYATTAAWWAATDDVGALLREVIRGELAIGYPPGGARQKVAALLAEGFERNAKVAAGATTDWIRDVVQRGFHALEAWGDGGDVPVATRQACVAELTAILNTASALSSGGPSWAESARGVRHALIASYDQTSTGASSAESAGDVAALHPRHVRALFPAPPTNVSDPS